MLERLSSIDAELRIIDSFLAHGAGFAAYLRLNDTTPDDPDIATKYRAVYADAWDSLDDLATDTIEALGWREGLTEFMTTADIPDSYLTWNLRQAHGHLHDMYDFVELDGVTYAFHKQSPRWGGGSGRPGREEKPRSKMTIPQHQTSRLKR